MRDISELLPSYTGQDPLPTIGAAPINVRRFYAADPAYEFGIMVGGRIESLGEQGGLVYLSRERAEALLDSLNRALADYRPPPVVRDA